MTAYGRRVRTIDFLDHGLARAPDKGFIRDTTRRYSHREAAVLSHRIAHGLRAAGLLRGSRVAFYSPNSALAFIALLGVLRAGAVWQPVHSRNPIKENIEFLVENGCEFCSITAAWLQKPNRFAPRFQR